MALNEQDRNNSRVRLIGVLWDALGPEETKRLGSIVVRSASDRVDDMRNDYGDWVDVLLDLVVGAQDRVAVKYLDRR